jgi:hypothetical protein
VAERGGASGRIGRTAASTRGAARSSRSAIAGAASQGSSSHSGESETRSDPDVEGKCVTMYSGKGYCLFCNRSIGGGQFYPRLRSRSASSSQHKLFFLRLASRGQRIVPPPGVTEEERLFATRVLSTVHTNLGSAGRARASSSATRPPTLISTTQHHRLRGDGESAKPRCSLAPTLTPA